MTIRAVAGAALLLVGCGGTSSEAPTETFAKCEDALKSQLKAPSTYHRVSDLEPCEIFCAIEYDAQNSFGAMLRGKGYCSIDQKTGVATWLQEPELP